MVQMTISVPKWVRDNMREVTGKKKHLGIGSVVSELWVQHVLDYGPFDNQRDFLKTLPPEDPVTKAMQRSAAKQT